MIPGGDDGREATAPGPPPHRAGALLNLLVLVLVTYLAWGVLLFLVQRAVIFPGRGLPPVPGVRESLPELRLFWLPVPGGRVEAWFLPPHGGGPGPAIVFTHGNGELIDHWAHELLSFNRLGVGVMLVEYPGYGRSSGRPSRTTLRAAVLAAYDTLETQPEVDAERIVAYGRSIGAGPAADLALERPVAAVVLQSGFTSLRAFAGRYLLPGFLVRDRFDVLEAMRVFPGPVLVVHGRRDDVIPYSHGQALAAASPRATLVSYDCAHNDCPPAWEPHVRRVLSFLVEEGVAP